MQPITPAALLDPLLDLLLLLLFALILISRRKPAGKRAPVNDEAGKETAAAAPAGHLGARLRALRLPRLRRRYGLWIGWFVWGTQWLFATPRVSFGALSLLEVPPVDVRAALGDTPVERTAMVVLTGGALTPKPGVSRSELLQGASMPRALGAARLYLERPVGHIIITGRADSWDFPDACADAMADVLVAYGVPKERILVEPLAMDTRQNALYSTWILRTLDVDKVIVVTSALHIPRSIAEFSRAGQKVIGVPVDHRWEKPEGWAPYVPSMISLVRMGQVLHEVLGPFQALKRGRTEPRRPRFEGLFRP